MKLGFDLAAGTWEMHYACTGGGLFVAEQL